MFRLIYALQKNMCIIVTEAAKKTEWMKHAEQAGYNYTLWKPMADLVWEMATTNSTGKKKSILVRIFFIHFIQ